MADTAGLQARRRLTRTERRAQLLDVARTLIREAGTDELTLARVAERAGVTKPVVYDHFGDRSGILAELFREFEARQREVLAAALADAEPVLDVRARLVAAAFVDCCLAEGRELADVVAALAGSSELRALRQEAEDAYLAMCQEALEPVGGLVAGGSLDAVIGAGDALVRSTLDGRITAARARDVLTRVIVAVVAPEPAA